MNNHLAPPELRKVELKERKEGLWKLTYGVNF